MLPTYKLEIMERIDGREIVFRVYASDDRGGSFGIATWAGMAQREWVDHREDYRFITRSGIWSIENVMEVHPTLAVRTGDEYVEVTLRRQN